MIYTGGPCPCDPCGRRVRYFVAACPGLRAEISCRANDETGPSSVRRHAPPVDHDYAVRLPDLALPRNEVAALVVRTS